MILHGYVSHCQLLSQHLFHNELSQAVVQKESHHSSELLLYLMITIPEVRQVATVLGHEFQADISISWVEIQT